MAPLLQQGPRLVAGQLPAAIREPRAELAVAADLFQCRGHVDEVDALPLHLLHLDLVDRQVGLSEGIDALAKPGGVEVAAGERRRAGALVIHPHDEDAPVLAVGEAGRLLRQRASRRLMPGRNGDVRTGRIRRAALLPEVEDV